VGLPRFFALERIGGRRRLAVEGGVALGICAYLGPGEGAVDLLEPEGAVAARIRGGTMAVRTFHATLAAGEVIRVFGGPALVTIESDRRARTEVSAAEEADGWRCLTWRRDGWIAGVLRVKPRDGRTPWSLEVPDGEEPMRVLAVLHAVERLLREEEGAEG
jgi:hypothetical protein